LSDDLDFGEEQIMLENKDEDSGQTQIQLFCESREVSNIPDTRYLLSSYFETNEYKTVSVFLKGQ
jgi:hypothetical protein